MIGTTSVVNFPLLKWLRYKRLDSALLRLSSCSSYFYKAAFPFEYACYGKAAARFITTNLGTDENFKSFRLMQDSTIEQLPLTAAKVYVVFAYTSWSSRCQKFFKTFNRLSAESENFQKHLEHCIRFNVEESPNLTKKFEIKFVPTLQLWYYGRLLNELNGDADETHMLRFIYQMNEQFHLSGNSHLFAKKYFLECSKYFKTHKLDALKALNEEAELNAELMKFAKPYITAYNLHLELSSQKILFHRILELVNILRLSYPEVLDSDTRISAILSNAIILLFDHSKTVDEPLNSILEAIEILSNPLETKQKRHSVYKKYKDLLYEEPQLTADSLLLYNSIQITYSAESYTSKKRESLAAGDISSKQLALLGRLNRVVASKFFRNKKFRESIHCAVNYSYMRDIKANLPQQYLSHGVNTLPSVILIKSLFNSLGYDHPEVKRGQAMITVATKRDEFFQVTIPFPRTAKGGRPRMLRGKSGKWEWLGPEWKPPWVKRPTKWAHREEWAWQ